FEDPDRVDDIAGVLAQSSPLPGRTGSPQDIAHAALFLASDEGAYVSGHTLVVDAGLTSGVRGGPGSIFSKRGPMLRGGGQRGLPDEA
ncbi:SDR family oxidoreductase, partial [Myxococcota bacterium]|nr:SDR family oxidoreductase [Myxococcota bacterium]